MNHEIAHSIHKKTLYNRALFLDSFDNMCMLQHLLSPVRSLDNLRDRRHSFNLPDYSTDTHKKSFVRRSLYKFI